MRLFLTLLCVCLLSGCQTTKPKPSKDSVSEAISAFGTVTEGLTNQNITQEDLKRVGKQMQKDPEVKSAVESINQALAVQQTGVKYCPKDGQRFDSSVTECPIHHVKLEIVD